ncbi:DUF1707 SHOCT-like domain-containing protein [Microlunatus soli]|uniref:DUF1707 domain-containing protein n=1 Tax=Microlunatus soli TaxID=630515 RepID=A0A1H1V8K9_9ACTN|nr:DUF1707 domain-containing protein [Microlunatus soli]SDS80821.1 protein of unknown function [Microlunatus soli]
MEIPGQQTSPYDVHPAGAYRHRPNVPVVHGDYSGATASFAPVPRAPAAERVGDAERSAVCDALSTHFAAGRLGAEDLEYRLTMAVQAVTRDDLYRLTADLPTASQPVPSGHRPPPTQRAWPALSVLAVLALIGSFVVAGGMLMVLGAVEPFLFVAACFGGTAAALGGASGTYLLMRHLRLRRADE